jgi:hypothetical protein
LRHRASLHTSAADLDPSLKNQVTAGRFPVIGLGEFVAPSTFLLCGMAGDIPPTDLDVCF